MCKPPTNGVTKCMLTYTTPTNLEMAPYCFLQQLQSCKQSVIGDTSRPLDLTLKSLGFEPAVSPPCLSLYVTSLLITQSWICQFTLAAIREWLWRIIQSNHSENWFSIQYLGCNLISTDDWLIESALQDLEGQFSSTCRMSSCYFLSIALKSLWVDMQHKATHT